MNTQHTKVPYVWLSGLSMLGFLATDMYLPAFDILRQDLATSSQMIGWSLSIFLLGMAIGQVVYGPLSERFGKKRVLISSLVIFSVGTIICALSSNVELLLAGRFIQSIGAAGATIIWQAFVIEKYDDKTSQRIFATVMPLVALSPALAPLLGALLEAQFGWQSIFYCLLLIGIAWAFRSSFIDFKCEKDPLATVREKNIKTSILKQYVTILKSKKFSGNMIIYAACSAAFFAWLTGSPFAMSAMGYSGTDIGLSYLPQTIAFIIGGYSCRYLLNRYSSEQLLPWLLKLFILSVVAMFSVASLATQTSIIPLLIPMCFMAAANGGIYPIVANNALLAFKNSSASASGLLNFLQMMLCVLASGVVSLFSDYGVLAMTAVMVFQGILVLFGYSLIAKQRKLEKLVVATV
ncbi:Bcr/CflA family multidrug efflux MFS transporter [Psychromonas sp. psych-6C06]|uniref:purine nucleoside transporter PunC n=1 Tax=Psychromonas sp. psych-6C06 TaxID=2058089 RepID=UPI000C332701|nr:purine nucleoside transporter PunC [Psychromonas sp. psych-6C06]PKF62250.1 Bcr/CflA family multidrug efflux MFS transporter [Psychromonas sp. psych-6C06]